jgi:hypothetical protein
MVNADAGDRRKEKPPENGRLFEPEYVYVEDVR